MKTTGTFSFSLLYCYLKQLSVNLSQVCENDLFDNSEHNINKNSYPLFKIRSQYLTIPTKKIITFKGTAPRDVTAESFVHL